jgi:hypothetical protein
MSDNGNNASSTSNTHTARSTNIDDATARNIVRLLQESTRKQVEYQVGNALSNIVGTIIEARSEGVDDIVPNVLQSMNFSLCEFVDKRSHRPCTKLRWTYSNHYCKDHSIRHERRDNTHRQQPNARSGAPQAPPAQPVPSSNFTDGKELEGVLYTFAPDRRDPNQKDYVSDDDLEDIDLGIADMEVDNEQVDPDKELAKIKQQMRNAYHEKEKEKLSE